MPNGVAGFYDAPYGVARRRGWLRSLRNGSELVIAGSRGVDVVVVGGGAAGCVVAARLAESESRSVLLLEAGPDRRADTPKEIRDGWSITRDFDWGFVSEPDARGAVQSLWRNKLVGGHRVHGVRPTASSPRSYRRGAVSGGRDLDVRAGRRRNAGELRCRGRAHRAYEADRAARQTTPRPAIRWLSPKPQAQHRTRLNGGSSQRQAWGAHPRIGPASAAWRAFRRWEARTRHAR